MPISHIFFRNGLIIVSFLLVFLVVVILALSFMQREKEGVPPVVATEVEIAPVVDIKTISGTIMMVDPDGAFLRVAVPGEGTVSVGLGGLSAVVIDGKEVNISDIEPMSTITVTTEVLPNTEAYDLLIQENAVPEVSTRTFGAVDRNESTEERLDRMLKMSEFSTVE
ncbi:hypothetical protein GW766_01680 [Candidatus Parcubacteria bacterium]|nr:hypothetical protein [Candidatus Parcubacteria bacterium]